MKKQTKQKISRNTSLDKDYPIKVGYAWAPAVIDDYPLAQLHVTDTKHLTGIVEREKTVLGMRFYQKTALGRKLTYNALRGNLRKIGVPADQIQWPGREVIRQTKFSLYNQADVGNESARGKVARDLVRKDSYVLQDSGGFQLVSGVEDFIDPLLVARKHSLYADSGVSLDLPVSGITDKKFALAAAAMLAANTKKILENTHSNVKVMNVCHGATIDIRGAFLDVVTKEPAHSLCIAGLRRAATNSDADFDRSSPVAFASHIVFAMLKTEKLYHHYHVLGVATPWQMALIALIANLHQKIVTSDSASHSLSAKSGILIDYAQQQAFKNSGYTVNSYSQLYCSCPMCYTLKDSLWYKIGASWMPAIHNIYTLLRSADTFDHLAKVLLAEKATDQVISRELLLNSPKLPPAVVNDFQKAVKLVMHTSKASQVKSLPESAPMGGLFQQKSASKVPPRFVEILHSYEKYHKAKWI